MTVHTNHQGLSWVFLTRCNFDEIAEQTGKTHAELEDIMSYQEEMGNHHAPVALPRSWEGSV